MIRGAWCTRDGELIGDVHIGTVTDDSIAYTASYVQKALTTEYIRQQHERDDRVKQYAVSSKHMGAGFITPEITRMYRENNLNYISKKGNGKIALPRYYRRKLWTPDEMLAQGEQIRDKMEEQMNIERQKYEQLTGKNYEEKINSEKRERWRKLFEKKLDKDKF